MGLGGRREKQVIAADPRNTAWLRDTNAPGYKLLTSMGWRPEGASSAGPSDNSGAEDSDGGEQRKIGLMAHNSSRRLKVIPIPKAGMEGIGYKPAGSVAANTGIGALPTSIGGTSSMSSAASSVFSRLGSKAALQFVSAGASKEVINKAKTEGGEFAGLLQRLNAAAASSSPSPAMSDAEDGGDEGKDHDKEDEENTKPSSVEGDEDEQPEELSKEERRARKKQRKMEKEAKKELKRQAKMDKKHKQSLLLPLATSGTSTPASTAASASPEPSTIVVTSTTVTSQSASPAPPVAARFNPRMAARARHIASKRMLHASADALAEILGIAPSPSPGPSSGTSTPTGFISSTSLPSTREASAAPLPKATAAANDNVPTPETEEEVRARRKAEKKAAKALAKTASSQQDSGATLSADTVDKTKSGDKKNSKKRKRADEDGAKDD